ncbi:NB-ARC domain-containing disease resistance protein [Zostera marina]|uniref:NB-ARC domain-containing disease resistance protein n=1 Tax=Zostera marina TaxID=29655 RepID=A0A0K9PUY7_ZOSMR|nr:NB-ARC domain-containing disease resistance protein [Zostera marina]
MDLQQESFRIGALQQQPITSRNVSSSSSAAYLSAIQSPFFSPRSVKSSLSSPHSAGDDHSDVFPLTGQESGAGSHLASQSASATTYLKHKLESITSGSNYVDRNSSFSTCNFEDPDDIEDLDLSGHLMSSPTSYGSEASSSSNYSHANIPEKARLESRRKRRRKRRRRLQKLFFAPSLQLRPPTFRSRTCDVYIGFHGRSPSLLRFTNWLRAELEYYGVSSFAVDRARCRYDWNHDLACRAMKNSSIGVVIISKNSFSNPYSIDELESFMNRKALFPIFFDLTINDCIARDIIEQRGKLWEKHGGELWMLYEGGTEKEWTETVNGITRLDDWRFEAKDGNWRDCIVNTVFLLASRLGRRSIVEKVNRWKERVARDELPFPRNDDFVGRKNELIELESVLFGDICHGDSDIECIEVRKTRRRQKNKATRSHSRKGKEVIVPKKSCKEGKATRRTRNPAKGICCISGESGIGKTELALEYAYRFSQRYKMVLWIGGESRYIRQNYLNLQSFFEVEDVGSPVDDDGDSRGGTEKSSRVRSFEKQEERAIARMRKELTRDVPFLVVIDNLESENDWWDHRNVMDLLPQFGGETHFIITTRLPRVMNVESVVNLEFLSAVEAFTLMKGSFGNYPIAEMDALRLFEERLGRLTLGLAIVGAMITHHNITPSRLLDMVTRVPVRDWTWSNTNTNTNTNTSSDRYRNLLKHKFLMQLLEACFSIFDRADGFRSLSTKMVQVCGWFAPSAIPVSLLALAASRIPGQVLQPRSGNLWVKCRRAVTLCSISALSTTNDLESEAASKLVKSGFARRSIRMAAKTKKTTSKTVPWTTSETIHFHELIKLYARMRGSTKVAHAMTKSISQQPCWQHSDHLFAACFLLFGIGNDPITVELKPPELLCVAKSIVLPLAINTFLNFSRCIAALELLKLCTYALEKASESVSSQSGMWIDKTILLCSSDVSTAKAKSKVGNNVSQHDLKKNHKCNRCSNNLWRELTAFRATMMETMSKLLARGGQYDLGVDLISKVIDIRKELFGEQHPETVAAQETLGKIRRLLTTKTQLELV